jgi:hypothetical protein
VPWALSQNIQVKVLPVIQPHTHSVVRNKHPYGLQTAVSQTFPRSHQRTWGCDLEVSRRHHSDAVRVKRSISNVVSKARVKILLVMPSDRGKRSYLPGAAPMASDLYEGPEKFPEKLGVCCTPRKKRERRTSRSPGWLGRNSTNARRV